MITEISPLRKEVVELKPGLNDFGEDVWIRAFVNGNYLLSINAGAITIYPDKHMVTLHTDSTFIHNVCDYSAERRESGIVVNIYSKIEEEEKWD